MSERATIAVWWSGPPRPIGCSCGERLKPVLNSNCADDFDLWPIWQCGRCLNRYGGQRDYEMEEAFAQDDEREVEARDGVTWRIYPSGRTDGRAWEVTRNGVLSTFCETKEKAREWRDRMHAREQRERAR